MYQNHNQNLEDNKTHLELWKRNLRRITETFIKK